MYGHVPKDGLVAIWRSTGQYDARESVLKLHRIEMIISKYMYIESPVIPKPFYYLPKEPQVICARNGGT